MIGQKLSKVKDTLFTKWGVDCLCGHNEPDALHDCQLAQTSGRSCIKLYWKGSTQCLDAEAQWVESQDELLGQITINAKTDASVQEDCGYYIYENQGLKQAETMACLDTWSDEVAWLLCF